MDHKTLTALQGSIQKWTDIVNGTGVDEGPENCPLCIEFQFIDGHSACDGCPVADHSGETHCDGTPYEDWNYHQDEHYFESEGHPPGIIQSGCSKCQQLAQDELNFLKSLLPVDINPQ